MESQYWEALRTARGVLPSHLSGLCYQQSECELQCFTCMSNTYQGLYFRSSSDYHAFVSISVTEDVFGYNIENVNQMVALLLLRTLL